MNEKYYTTIDFGETYTKIVRVSIVNSKMYLCSVAKALTKGVRNGEIYSVEEIKSTIQELIEKAKFSLETIDNLIIVLPSTSLSITKQRLDIRVKNNPTTVEDIRALQNAISRSMLEENTTAVGVYPVRYFSGNMDLGRIEPIGDRCETIGLEAFIASLPTSESRQMVSIVESCGIKVLAVYIQPVANAILLLKQAEFKNGAVIIDIGGKGIGISMYQNNLPINYYRTSKGIEFVIDELQRSFNIDRPVARELLEKYGSAEADLYCDYGVYKNRLDGRMIKEADIVKVIDNALNEILGETKRKIELFVTEDSTIPFILTGGGSNIHKIQDKFTRYLNYQCNLRGYNKVGGRDYSYNASIGATINYLIKNNLIKVE